MSTNSNAQGRAYEYAWLNTLYGALSKIIDTKIVNNSSLGTNKRMWQKMSSEQQEMFKISAESAVDTVLELEPLMSEANDGEVLILECQPDAKGQKGDVRDIVVRKSRSSWEIGLSVKHNHKAIKHSRLGAGIDFGENWYKHPCSKEYWSEVQPIFERLEKEKPKGTKWSELDGKFEAVYVPLLQAFINEIQRAYKVDKDIPRKMMEYLIGTDDYYKLVSADTQHLTLVHTFNIHGTLNKPSKVKVSAIRVPLIKLPTEFVALKFKTGSKTTVEMYLNNGWQLSFRIHNASKVVENSLKFDVNFIGMPVSVLTIECRWK